MRILPTLFQTYVFWSVFWLLAFFSAPSPASGIMFLFPPYGLFGIFHFCNFALVPFLLSALAAAFLVYCIRRRLPQNQMALLANLVFLVIFIVAAQAWLLVLMQPQLAKLDPECVNYTSFWSSFTSQEASPGHTTAFKDGRIYQWSFRQGAFYENTRATQYDIRLGFCKN